MFQARSRQDLDKKMGDWSARIDSAMMSDEDKIKYKAEIQAYYDKIALGFGGEQGTPGPTKQDSSERSTTGETKKWKYTPNGLVPVE